LLRSISDMDPYILTTRDNNVGWVVAGDEREELLIALCVVVTERGLAGTSPRTVAEYAGVEPEVFNNYFHDLEQCFVEAFDFCSDQLFTRIADAFVGSGGDFLEAARRTLAALLDAVASTPATAYALLVEFRRAGPRADAHRVAMMDKFSEFLTPGFRISPVQEPPQPRMVGQMIGGALWEIFARYAVEDRLDELPEALPAVIYLIFALVLGTEEAQSTLQQQPPT
jgi:AcrR family transcriptional regulator